MKISIEWSEGSHYEAKADPEGPYSLSEADYADYLAFCEQCARWQKKFHAIPPDAEPIPETEEQRAARMEMERHENCSDFELRAMLDAADAAEAAKTA